MDPDEYAQAKRLWRYFEEIKLPAAEREYVVEEFDNNLTAEEKSQSIVKRPIGDYYYRAVNLGHATYKIFEKKPITPYEDIIDEVMTELFGRNWRNYET